MRTRQFCTKDLEFILCSTYSQLRWGSEYHFDVYRQRITVSAAARCWVGLRRVYFGILKEDVLAKTDISGLFDMDLF